MKKKELQRRIDLYAEMAESYKRARHLIEVAERQAEWAKNELLCLGKSLGHKEVYKAMYGTERAYALKKEDFEDEVNFFVEELLSLNRISLLTGN